MEKQNVGISVELLINTCPHCAFKYVLYAIEDTLQPGMWGWRNTPKVGTNIISWYCPKCGLKI